MLTGKREKDKSNVYSYILCELNKSFRELPIVPFQCWFTIITLSVLATNHVVELWGSH